MNLLTLVEIRELNILVYGGSDTAMINTVNQHFPHSRLETLAQDLLRVGLQYRFDWETSWSIVSDQYFEYIIEFTYRGLTPDEPINFVYHVGYNLILGDYEAHCGYIRIPKHLQKQSISRHINKAFFNHYKSLNVKWVTLYATLEAGGYVWATAGFSAVYKADVELILQTVRRKMSEGLLTELNEEDVESLQEDFDQHYESGSTEPFPLYNWTADRNIGYEILVKSKWEGVLDLENPSQVLIFETYLNSKP